MIRQQYALAICRVSSPEQLENNSLNRQRDAVLRAAKEYDLYVPDDGWWSGNVSSKRGTNINRKDLQQILERCKKDKRIKSIIVDEVDRFMRSMLEMGYFLVEFKKLGVKVIFASQPNLKTDTATDTLLLMLEAFKAEGSNEERQHKSIEGNAKLLREGKYPFPPKPGYMRGKEKCIPEIHPARGPALQRVMIRIASRQITPTQGLVELNNSEFVKDGHAPFKMDKFRPILTDSFYSGVIEVDKQIKVRNENGLHEPLITMEQHLKLVRIMGGKPKNQKGPRKNGNPKYPMSNHVTHTPCKDQPIGRVVGFDHGNGKNPNLVYEKYRCRACRQYILRRDLHSMVAEQFKSISKDVRDMFLEALNKVWAQQEGEMLRAANCIRGKMSSLEQAITNHVEAIADPANATIKDNLLASIASKKEEISDLQNQLDQLKGLADSDKDRFLSFAFDFIDNVGGHFFDLNVSQEHRVRCKLIMFPAGFYLSAENKVYTPQISPIYGVMAKKKSTEVLKDSHLVRVRGL